MNLRDFRDAAITAFCIVGIMWFLAHMGAIVVVPGA